MRVGIFGGTFNPPHHGHVICAQEARIQLDLDEVRLMPLGTPVHREIADADGADSTTRLSMTRLAVIGQPGLEVSTLELDNDGPSYTVDTLEQLTAKEQGNEFTLIVGADQAMAFGKWRDPERIAELAQIAIAARVDHNQDEAVAEVVRATGGKQPQVFDMPRIDLSSSEIRERVYRGRTVAHMVPAGIPELIEERELYS
jgi:nicotinate-nucleotide adenylyltransferase